MPQTTVDKYLLIQLDKLDSVPADVLDKIERGIEHFKLAAEAAVEAEAGNIGVNIGVAAPMAFFPFSGWKDSFFGTLHAQARHSMEFYTQTKVVVERWPKEWSRQF